MAYTWIVIFIETRVFTRHITRLLPDDEYRQLQQELILRPNAGRVIPNSGGLRKLRWRTVSKGKRGGIRVIYYWFASDDEVYMLIAYGKGEKDDVSPQELKHLRKLVQEAMP